MTIDENEVAKFSALAEKWWDPNGPFKPLHKINPLRIEYIKEQVLNKFDSFENLKILDIGCGGGLISEPIARLGAKVTAVDASEKNIKTASLHASQNGLNIEFINSDSSELVKTKKAHFDVILALEIIEHVEDYKLFLSTLSDILKPNGILIITTINRTTSSYFQSIIAAEYILRWLPTGTHSWNKFLKPSEIYEPLENHGFKIANLSGISYNLLKDEFNLSKSLNNNYLMTFIR